MFLEVLLEFSSLFSTFCFDYNQGSKVLNNLVLSMFDYVTLEVLTLADETKAPFKCLL